VLRLFCVGMVTLAGMAAAQDWEPVALDGGWQHLSGNWNVEADMITGTADDAAAVALLDRELADFTLELEWQGAADARGGVQFRSHWLQILPVPEGVAPLEAPRQIYGYQAVIGAGKTGAVVDKHGRGALVDAADAAGEAVEADGWNQLRIVAEGAKTSVYVNDVLASELEDEVYIQGHVALVVAQGGAGEMRFRNVRLEDHGRTGTWRSIFDGESLAGWEEYGQEKWGIEDGAIAGRMGPLQSEGYLATEEHWRDFHVRGAFKMEGDGNFGLFYHSTIELREEDGYPLIAGVQGEVEPSYPGNTGWLYESYQRGWIVQPDRASLEAYALRPDEWNTIEIRSIGNRVSTWVNGIRVIELEDDDQRLFEGSFALQLHTGGTDGILWKDLYVKE